MLLKFAPLVCVLGCASPAFAQMTLGPVTEPSASSSAAIEMSLGSSEASSASSSTIEDLLPSSPASSDASEAPPSDDAQGLPSEDDTGEESDADMPAVPSGPPLSSKDAFAAFYKVCTDLGGGDAAAFDRANTDGWTPDDTEAGGPYRTVYSATKPISGFGDVQVWSSLERYASQRLGYCRLDFSDADSRLDFHDLDGFNGLAGTIDDEGENGVYGVWESPDKKLMVIADRAGGDASVEFNLLLPPAPPAQ